MATLILSTVGTALGGPVGAAIGALIGQSIDQELLGPSTRGPRVGDLSVQTSTYGTQIPRIYGRMRVAGSIVWATDLTEGSATSGVKGQPDTVYSYLVSFAVALSSRPVSAIGRIWADGKLIRGGDGVFTVNTVFRFHDGSEDQAVDPLIGSIEGLTATPAYRGHALAVFENLELAEFGNRIPFLTFEIVADEEPPAVAAILGDASGDAIAAGGEQNVEGYAAYGPSIKSAVEPLIDCFGLHLFDDGSRLRSPGSTPATVIGDFDLGCSADERRTAKLQREWAPAAATPAALRLTYYDPARDFQAGEARASTGDQSGKDERHELPAVLAAGTAKSICQQLLARRWASRDRLTLKLGPRHVALEPGSLLELPLSRRTWIAERCTIDGFVVIAELRPAWSRAIGIAGDSGRIVPVDDPSEADVTLAMFDVPDLGESSSQPTLLLAASSASRGWKGHGVHIGAGALDFATRTAVRKSLLGEALSTLGTGEPYLIDALASVDVELLDSDQWLTSCDDDALASGSNLALLGRELIQFGNAMPIGAGRFRLQRLLRGRGGTEWATGTHAAGEPFTVIEPDALRRIPLPAWIMGSQVTARIASGSEAPGAALIAAGESLRPPSPVKLEAAFSGAGDLSLTWVRRSRAGWAWIDHVDAPLGETREEYRVAVSGPLQSLEYQVTEAALTIGASELAMVGPGPTSVQVCQVGDWAISRPAERTIELI